MPTDPLTPEMTAHEYLAWERQQPERHEYLRGQLLPRAPGSPRHDALATAIYLQLENVTRGTPCCALPSTQRLVLSPPGACYVYADATVVCGSLAYAEGTTDVIANPRTIIEVLSRATEARDRGDKWDAYRRVPTLSEYVLVSQAVPRIEWFWRQKKSWRYEVVETRGRIDLGHASELGLEALHDGVLALPGD